jgi:hypothetical protein
LVTASHYSAKLLKRLKNQKTLINYVKSSLNTGVTFMQITVMKETRENTALVPTRTDEYLSLSTKILTYISAMYARDPESYTSGSVATGRASLAGQVKG